MRINSVSNVSFGAQTKKGNDYKKTHVGLAAAIITSSLTSTSQIVAEVYKGTLTGSNIIKPVKIAAAAIGISALFGTAVDYIFNRKNAKIADQNPMTLEQKFERDFNSSKFCIYYDSYDDAVIAENKDDSERYKFVHKDRSKKDNQYTLKEDGSVSITEGRDKEWNEPFIKNNEDVKKIVNEVKTAKFYSAMMNKDYQFSFDKAKNFVKLERIPLSTLLGPYAFDSFRIKPDGRVSIVTSDGQTERPIQNSDAAMIYNNYSKQKTN